MHENFRVTTSFPPLKKFRPRNLDFPRLGYASTLLGSHPHIPHSLILAMIAPLINTKGTSRFPRV